MSRAAPDPVSRPTGWLLWLVLVAASAAVLVAARVTSLPVVAEAAAGVAVTSAFAFGLARRLGRRAVVAAGVALALGAGAQAAEEPLLLAGVGAATTVLAAVLAVALTQPAETMPAVARELLVAVVVAGVGALAVATYQGDVDVVRFRYLTLLAAFLAALALAGSRGIGRHGLGRRGALGLFLGGLVLLGALAYGEALGRWGSPGLVQAVEQVRRTAVDVLGAVPHPIEALVGFPALAYGVRLRALRRQGWWVCVFGVAATVSTSAALVDPGVPVARVVLGATYSLVIGIALGYLVIRLDGLLRRGTARSGSSAGGPSRPGGRQARARRRVEPPRSRALT